MGSTCERFGWYAQQQLHCSPGRGFRPNLPRAGQADATNAPSPCGTSPWEEQ